MSAEKWLPVDFDPGYEVSNHGRVRSLVRPGSNGTPYVMVTRVLNAQPGTSFAGYVIVDLRDRTRARRHRTCYMHQLVAAAFIGPRPDGLVVRHLDGDSLNNAPSNLAYGTVSENVHDTVRHGNHQAAGKTHCHRGHEFTPENTRIYVTRQQWRTRCCLTCERERIPCPECGLIRARASLPKHIAAGCPDRVRPNGEAILWSAVVPVSERAA